jgi:hypothetical protein
VNIVWGLILIALGLLAWGGQTLSWLARGPATRMGLADAEDKVDPVFFADGVGEAKWDALTLWPLLIAGVLLVADSASWPYYGLIGGSIYVYFGGRGILVRLEMHKRGLAIGTPADVRVAFAALTLWGVAGLVTIVMAIAELV